ncbi:hypothetical protein BHE74_00023204 [Ensete ventricosum]|nr:hypothetical protein BHE74_00023204 [Ensete ventricosum]
MGSCDGGRERGLVEKREMEMEGQLPSKKAATRGMERPYRGIRMRKWGKWVAEIREPNKRSRIWLGSYCTPVAAARAYDTALFYLRGRTARLNFPDDISVDDGDAAMSAALIRKKAAEVGAKVDALQLSGAAVFGAREDRRREGDQKRFKNPDLNQAPSPESSRALLVGRPIVSALSCRQLPAVSGTVGWSTCRVDSTMPPATCFQGHCWLIGPTCLFYHVACCQGRCRLAQGLPIDPTEARSTPDARLTWLNCDVAEVEVWCSRPDIELVVSPCALARLRSTRCEVGARSDGWYLGVRLGKSAAGMVKYSSSGRPLTPARRSGWAGSRRDPSDVKLVQWLVFAIPLPRRGARAYIVSVVDHPYLATRLPLWLTLSSYASTTPVVLAVRDASTGRGIGLTCVRSVVRPLGIGLTSARLAVRSLGIRPYLCQVGRTTTGAPYLRPTSFPRWVGHIDEPVVRRSDDVAAKSLCVISYGYLNVLLE